MANYRTNITPPRLHLPASTFKMRQCIGVSPKTLETCGRLFLSEGSHHRMCVVHRQFLREGAEATFKKSARKQEPLTEAQIEAQREAAWNSVRNPAAPNNKPKRAVIVRGKHYNSITDAAYALGESGKNIRNRIVHRHQGYSWAVVATVLEPATGAGSDASGAHMGEETT